MWKNVTAGKGGDGLQTQDRPVTWEIREVHGDVFIDVYTESLTGHRIEQHVWITGKPTDFDVLIDALTEVRDEAVYSDPTRLDCKHCGKKMGH